MGDIFGDHRLSDAVGPDDDDVGGFLQEPQRVDLVDEFPVNLLRPVPVEVAQELEAAELRPPSQASFQAG